MAQSRRDQLQAYRFLTRRAQAALLTGEPDIAEPPMRRLTVITVSGIMIAILVAAGFGLKGLIRPVAKGDWKTEGTVVIEKETGTRFVLLKGVLHPALNFASAELAASNKNGPHIVTVGRGSLAHTPRGTTIGVAGLPDSLPAAKGLLAAPLVTCSSIVKQGVDGVSARVSIQLGVAPKASALKDDAAVLVSTPSGAQSLLYNGRRLALTDADLAGRLGFTAQAPLIVGTAFVDAIPTGTPIAAPHLPGFGQPTQVRVRGQDLQVGQLIKVTDNNSVKIALADGIAAVTPVEAALIGAARTGNGAALPTVEATTSDLSGLPASQAFDQQPIAGEFAGLPATAPTLDRSAMSSGRLCAVWTKGSDAAPHFTIPAGTAPTGFGKITESAASSHGVADSVSFKPGGAALVRSTHASTVYVLAEPGNKFPLASADALGALGYGDVKAQVVPDFLLATLPQGPALDPTAARTPVN